MTNRDELLQSMMSDVSANRGAPLVDEIAQSWLNIVRKFAPLIGATSVLLIFERSLDQNVAAFPWLPTVVQPSRPDSAVERLRASMATRPASDILAAHRTILATFIDMMTTLIGARLTVQFLRAAMNAAGAGSNTEENA